MVHAAPIADDASMTTTTAPPPPTEPVPPTHEVPPPPGGDRPPLSRSTTDRHLGGVAGGLARHFDVDATLVRAGIVIATIASFGVALAAYAAAWLLLPDDEGAEPLGRQWYDRHGDRAAGIALAVLVGVIAVAALHALFSFSFGWHGPRGDGFLLLGIAGIVVASRMDPNSRRRHRYRPPRGPGTGPDPTAPDDDQDRTLVTGPAPVDPAVLARRRMRRRIRNVSLLSSVVSASVVGLLWATGGWRVGGWAVAAVALACLVAGIATGPWFGWSWSLFLAALVTVLGLGISLVPGVTLRDGFGERIARPTTVAEAEAHRYHVGAGRQEIDLTGIALEPGSITHVRGGTGFGQLTVKVDRGVQVHLRGHLSGGTVRLDGDDDIDGGDIDLDRTFPPLGGPPESGRAPIVVVHVDTGFGVVEVDRVS